MRGGYKWVSGERRGGERSDYAGFVYSCERICCDARCDAWPFYKHAFASPRAVDCSRFISAADHSSFGASFGWLVGGGPSLTLPPTHVNPSFFRAFYSSSFITFHSASPPPYLACIAFPLCFPSPPYLPPFYLFPLFIDILLPGSPPPLPLPPCPLPTTSTGSIHSHFPLARLQDKRKAVAATSPEYDHSDGPPRAPCVGGQ